MAPALQTKWPPIGPESCWGSAVSDACPRRAGYAPFADEVQKAKDFIHPLLVAGSKVPKVSKSLLL